MTFPNPVHRRIILVFKTVLLAGVVVLGCAPVFAQNGNSGNTQTSTLPTSCAAVDATQGAQGSDIQCRVGLLLHKNKTLLNNLSNVVSNCSPSDSACLLVKDHLDRAMGAQGRAESAHSHATADDYGDLRNSKKTKCTDSAGGKSGKQAADCGGKGHSIAGGDPDATGTGKDFTDQLDEAGNSLDKANNALQSANALPVGTTLRAGYGSPGRPGYRALLDGRGSSAEVRMMASLNSRGFPGAAVLGARDGSLARWGFEHRSWQPGEVGALYREALWGGAFPAAFVPGSATGHGDQGIWDFTNSTDEPGYNASLHNALTVSSTTKFGVHAAWLVLVAADAVAGRFCNQVVVAGVIVAGEGAVGGGNTSSGCAPLTLARYALEGTYEVFEFIDQDTNKFELKGAYIRAEQIFDKVLNVQAAQNSTNQTLADIQSTLADIKTQLAALGQAEKDNQQRLKVLNALDRAVIQLLLTPEGRRAVDPSVLLCTGDNCPTVLLCPGTQCSFPIH
jgi:hypothetical protein